MSDRSKTCCSGAFGSLSLYSIPSRIGLYIYIFHVAAFVLANGFDIFSCLISAPRRPGKFRTTILGQSWRHIKLAEYSTAFPSTAATTHFAAMSPPEILMHTQSNTSLEENWGKKRKHVVASMVGCEDEVSVSRLQSDLPGVLAPWMVYDRAVPWAEVWGAAGGHYLAELVWLIWLVWLI